APAKPSPTANPAPPGTTAAAKAVEINKGRKMPPGFCCPARRERGAYPQRSATSEQRSWAAKEQGRLLPLFISTALIRKRRQIGHRGGRRKAQGGRESE